MEVTEIDEIDDDDRGHCWDLIAKWMSLKEFKKVTKYKKRR